MTPFLICKRALLALAVVSGPWGCRGGSDPGPPTSAYRGLDVVSPVRALFPGLSDTLVAAIDSAIAPLDAVLWQSTDTTIVTVTPAGVITATGLGRGLVILTSAIGGDQADTAVVDVIEPPTGRILFVGFREPVAGQTSVLYEIAANGLGGARPIADLKQIGRPAFSPDGQLMAINIGSLPVMYIYSSDGARRLATASAGLGCGSASPAWSPDGKLLAFSSCAAGRFDLWVYTLADSSKRRVSQFSQDASGSAQTSAFTPDGRGLIAQVFIRDSGATNPQQGQTELFRVELDGTRVPERLTRTRGHELSPFLDPVTGRVYFSRTLPDAPGSLPTAEAEAVFAAEGAAETDFATAGQITPTMPLNLAGFAPMAREVATSPNSEWIVFEYSVSATPPQGTRLGGRTGTLTNKQIHVMRLRDGLIVRLTPDFGGAFQPAWNSF